MHYQSALELIYELCGHLESLLIADVSPPPTLPPGKLSQCPYGGERACIHALSRLMSLPGLPGCCLLAVAARVV